MSSHNNNSNTPLAHQTDTYINPFEIGGDLDSPHETTTLSTASASGTGSRGGGGGISDPFADPLTSNLMQPLEPEFVDLSSPISSSNKNAQSNSNNSDSLQNPLQPQKMSSISNNSTSINITSTTPVVSGNIGSTSRSGGSGGNTHIGTGRPLFDSNTLDEPVSETILRDLRNIALKLQQVLHPKARRDVLKDCKWDLWGPLILCLALAIILCMNAEANQEVYVFTGVFVIVWCGAAIVTVNAKLLGGSVDCRVDILVRASSSHTIAVSDSGVSPVNFFSSSHLANRRALAVYPLFLFYFVIAWLVLITRH
ncbi:2029_t:CDS:2 [Ambispora leptoticha]|uniref:2029_t:CDS:1 n=1 Tax=Ambispora leptoticha TaxID=144679 RepID=A0A9N8VNG6_9GLOM|nr:2029_t:CDS:2 [Ambispora leptoticha]